MLCSGEDRLASKPQALCMRQDLCYEMGGRGRKRGTQNTLLPKAMGFLSSLTADIFPFPQKDRLMFCSYIKILSLLKAFVGFFLPSSSFPSYVTHACWAKEWQRSCFVANPRQPMCLSYLFIETSLLSYLTKKTWSRLHMFQSFHFKFWV